MSDFKKELEELLNKYSKENGSNTPDFILAEYLTDCLKHFDKAVNFRTAWYDPKPVKVKDETDIQITKSL